VLVPSVLKSLAFRRTLTPCLDDEFGQLLARDRRKSHKDRGITRVCPMIRQEEGRRVLREKRGLFIFVSPDRDHLVLTLRCVIEARVSANHDLPIHSPRRRFSVRTIQLRARQGRGDFTHSVPARHESDYMHGGTPALSCPSQCGVAIGGMRHPSWSVCPLGATPVRSADRS